MSYEWARMPFYSESVYLPWHFGFGGTSKSSSNYRSDDWHEILLAVRPGLRFKVQLFRQTGALGFRTLRADPLPLEDAGQCLGGRNRFCVTEFSADARGVVSQVMGEVIRQPVGLR
jgi:hypothetical protein